MLQEAIKKIKDEMAKEKKEYITLIGNYLLNQLNLQPEIAEKILAKDKTIVDSLGAIRKEASKQQKGGMAVISDEAGLRVVAKYYGFKEAQQSSAAVSTPETSKTETTEALPEIKISINDFLGF